MQGLLLVLVRLLSFDFLPWPAMRVRTWLWESGGASRESKARLRQLMNLTNNIAGIQIRDRL